MNTTPVGDLSPADDGAVELNRRSSANTGVLVVLIAVLIMKCNGQRLRSAEFGSKFFTSDGLDHAPVEDASPRFFLFFQ